MYLEKLKCSSPAKCSFLLFPCEVRQCVNNELQKQLSCLGYQLELKKN